MWYTGLDLSEQPEGESELMYSSFRVKNFRGFRDLKLNDIGRINLFAGKNNAGKTSLLEAMHIHSGNRNPNTLLRSNVILDDDFPWRSRLHAPYPEPPNIVSWDDVFNDSKTEKKISMTATLTRAPGRVQIDQADYEIEIDSLSPDSEEFIATLREYEVEDDDRYENVEILKFNSNFHSKPLYVLLANDRVKGAGFKSNILIASDFINTRAHMNTGTIAQLYSLMKKSGNIDSFIKALRIVEPKLQDLDLLYSGNRPLIYVDIGIGKLLPITSLGDGMNRIAGLILAMSEVSDGVIFVDEIENGYHHSIQREVWRIIGQVSKEANIQVFATTHSKEMLVAAHEAFKDDDPYEFRYHRLDRDMESGNVEAVTYNEYGMKALAAFDFDHEVRG